MSEGLTIFYHILSPYAKTVLATANHLSIAHTERSIDLRKNEQKSEWYLKINSAGKVPAIKDGDYTMAESIPIWKYLIESRKIGTPLYPNDDEEKRAGIDEVLTVADELGARTTAALLNCFWGRIQGNVRNTQAERDEYINRIYEVYEKLEGILEKVNTKYFNSNCKAFDNSVVHPSLADFYINNLIMTMVEKEMVNLDKFPLLKKWLEVSSEIPALAEVIRRSNAEMKKVKFVVKFVLPIIRCLTCRCCR